MDPASTFRPRGLTGLLTLFLLATPYDAVAKRGDAEPEAGSVPCPEVFERVQAKLHKYEADLSDTPAVRLARSVIPTTSEPDLLEDARAACEEDMTVKRIHRLPAFLCIAESSARLGELAVDPVQNRAHAYCAYEVSADLARRDEMGDKGIQADAHEGRAEALIALADLNGLRRAEYIAAAIAAYQEAIGLRPTAARHLTLGRVHLAQGDVRNADTQITAAVKRQPEGLEMALALIELAELKRAKDRSLEEVLTDLERARTAAPNSVATNGAIGIVLFELGKIDEARQAFEKVLSDSVTDDGEGQSRNYRVEAHYHLALLDARTARTTSEWQAVVSGAERAVQAGAADSYYRRLVCLAHIARGGAGVRDGGSAAWCEGLTTPEDQLLRGMFYLRQAQYVPRFRLSSRPGPTETRFRQYLSSASEAFDNGLIAMASQNPQTIEWPGLTDPPDLSKTLAFGKVLVEHAGSFCRSELADTGKIKEMALFERYRVQGCSPPE